MGWNVITSFNFIDGGRRNLFMFTLVIVSLSYPWCQKFIFFTRWQNDFKSNESLKLSQSSIKFPWKALESTEEYYIFVRYVCDITVLLFIMLIKAL